MKQIAIIIVVAVIACLFFNQGNGLAQEDETLYSYGEVLSASQDQVLVREFNYATGEDMDVLYLFDKDTVFDAAIQPGDIRPSDLVDIEFIELPNGSRLVKEILVDRLEDYQDFID
jgi:hypothetical protein